MTEVSTPSPVVSRAHWLEHRLALLAEEKAFTAARDALSARRRAMPWVRIDKDYRFIGPNGAEKLLDLFAGRTQLIVYHFMFGADWEQGCPSCSFWVDNYDGIGIHLAHRDTALVTISKAPFQTLEAYQKRMGWRSKWVSASQTDFNEDFCVSFSAEELEAGTQIYNYRQKSFNGREAPGISVFTKNESDDIFHTYSTFARGMDMLNGAYHFLDLTPKGRDEEGLAYGMEWLRRHDQYQTG